jgi:2,4-dienoyl-CoA reductase-like NADH-dependent reductase (Old Yellow Enzyme family)/NADPH-dependent 2,4-dienoyl-CoA reductase/sulfur reductase-like enzyme
VAAYEKLFEPGNIGNLVLKNRLVMAPMGFRASNEDHTISERELRYYAARAQGGVGLIISSSMFVLKQGRSPRFPCIYDDSFITGLKRLTETVHEYGAKIAGEIHHHGMYLCVTRNHFQDPEKAKEIDIIAPSPVPYFENGYMPRVITPDDIRELVTAFREGARRVKAAGFDAVDIHACHGYLLGSFLNPYTNRRADGYGGSVEKRARLVCEIIAAVRSQVGSDFPVTIRISGDSYLPGGISPEESAAQALLFEEAGVDAIHVSAGAIESNEYVYPNFLFADGINVHLADNIKKAVKIPVITAGKISGAEMAESILRAGRADFIALGRPLLADPGLPEKYKESRPEDVRQCLYCSNCTGYLSDEYGAPLLRCTVNPEVLEEEEMRLEKAAAPKDVLVIGGGLAGMQAAVDAAKRGHRVRLWERAERLGGRWNTVCREPFKKDFKSLLRYLSIQLQKAGVAVTTGREATPQAIEQACPEVVIIATGGVPLSLRLPGCEKDCLVQAVDVIEGKAQVGDRVVVVGGRSIGLEIALTLAEEGKEVSIVTDLELGKDKQGRGMVGSIYRTLRKRLLKLRVPIFQHTSVREIRNDGLYIVENKALLFIEADTIVQAIGFKADDNLYQAIKGKHSEVYVIGDAIEARTALDAIKDGAVTARAI